MDVAQLVELLFQVAKTLSGVVEVLVTEALKNPAAGFIYGGMLILISKLKHMLFWMGVLLIFYSVLTLFAQYAGINLPFFSS